jgi:hypothetical protein
VPYYAPNSQIFHEGRLEYYEQLSQLCQCHINNRNHDKNLGTDKIFESSMNFKGVQTFWEKSDKFSEISS